MKADEPTAAVKRFVNLNTIKRVFGAQHDGVGPRFFCGSPYPWTTARERRRVKNAAARSPVAATLCRTGSGGFEFARRKLTGTAADLTASFTWRGDAGLGLGKAQLRLRPQRLFAPQCKPDRDYFAVFLLLTRRG